MTTPVLPNTRGRTWHECTHLLALRARIGGAVESVVFTPKERTQSRQKVKPKRVRKWYHNRCANPSSGSPEHEAITREPSTANRTRRARAERSHCTRADRTHRAEKARPARRDKPNPARKDRVRLGAGGKGGPGTNARTCSRGVLVLGLAGPGRSGWSGAVTADQARIHARAYTSCGAVEGVISAATNRTQAGQKSNPGVSKSDAKTCQKLVPQPLRKIHQGLSVI